MFKYIGQLFEVEANTIVTTDLEPAVSIDHNQRLVTGVQSLRTALGITQLTPMAAGTQVKQYKYTKGTSPEQVAEGEIIPLTKYDRKLVNTFEIVLKKYRKQTTAEAIQRAGRRVAVNDTDTLLIREVEKEVKADFFKAINAGTGTATPTAVGLQAALAAVWGKVNVYYQDIDATPVYFVNPLDVADYLATASITTQNAFGFSYVENFLGLGMAILDASVTQGTVLGTARENLNGAYTPASGDVGTTFNLTADETGMVGMTHYLDADRASVDTLLMSGCVFYAEDASGIFKAAIKKSTT